MAEIAGRNPLGLFAASLLILGVGFPLAARANGPAEEAARINLLGVWAERDCSKPPAIGNLYNVFEATKDGVLRFTEQQVPGVRVRATVEQITVLSSAKFALRLIEEEPVDQRYTLTLEIKDERIAYLQSVLENGKIIIKDGRFVAWFNKPAAVLQHCKAKPTT